MVRLTYFPPIHLTVHSHISYEGKDSEGGAFRLNFFFQHYSKCLLSVLYLYKHGTMVHVTSRERPRGSGKSASPVAGDAKCGVSLQTCISRGQFRVALSDHDVKKKTRGD